MMIWFDVETVGLNGPCLRVQYALGNGPVKFVDFPMDEGLPIELVRALNCPTSVLCAYNAAFDVFHLYRILHHGRGWCQTDRSEVHPPLPCRVLDLQIPAMLRGPFAPWAFAKGKARSVARVRRIPRVAAGIVMNQVYGSLRPTVPEEYKLLVGMHEVKGKPDLCTLSFSVDGRASLKAHMRHWGLPTLELADSWPLPPREIEKPWLPYWDEVAYAPYTRACTEVMNDPTSPFHKYCALDILYLQVMYEKLGKPEPDHHSDCVHAVAYTRYAGIPCDMAHVERSRAYYEEKVVAAQAHLGECNLKSSKQRLELLQKHDPLIQSSKRKVLEVLAKTDRPSAPIAKAMLDFGKYKQRRDQCVKVLECKTGRVHPSLRVMGTATVRMGGEGGLNWQGIAQVEGKRRMGIRAAVEADCGGDFDALEMTIAAAVYRDEQLQADLDNLIDLHAISGSMLPEAIKNGYTYEWIVANKKDNPIAKALRSVGKTVNFGILYGAAWPKIQETVGCTENEAKELLERFYSRYKGIGAYRKSAEAMVMTADTEKWKADSVGQMRAECTDLTGYTRAWAFEKQVADLLWRMGHRKWRTGLNGSVVRSQEKGAQAIDQAIRSALLGSAIAIQNAACRQMCNSPVQSSGANMTKILMARVWDRIRVPILNVHDELILSAVGPCVDRPMGLIQEVTKNFLAEFKRAVPSLNIKMVPLRCWADK
jgi:DNA polymerase I-like protein with 3'-5' exonuclease and polymerase domains